ncbi:hypothetical protein GCM10027174_23410 [Salinifilum aidingensis]
MRSLTRTLAAVAALAVAALGLLAVVETAAALLRPAADGLLVPWRPLAAQLGAIPWSAPVVRGAGAGVAVLGLLLLVLATAARRRHIPLHDPAPGVTVVTDRRSLARLVAHEVREQPDVESTAVTARSGRVRIKARTIGDPQRTRQQVTESAQQALSELPLPRRPHVSVSVSEVKEPQ